MIGIPVDEIPIRDLLLMAYKSNGYTRRTVSSLATQLNIPETLIRMTLELNRDIWCEYYARNGTQMYEIYDSILNQL